MSSLQSVLVGDDWLYTQAGDCLELMARMPSQSVDFVFGSPPYEDCRPYNGQPLRKGQEWVNWMVRVVIASLRVSRGAVAFVIDGRVKKGQYSMTPQLLMADLHRTGVKMQRPNIYKRFGVPGKNPFLRNLYEPVLIAFDNPGYYCSPTEMGSAPKCGPGGPTSARTTKGERSNKSRKKYKQPERTNAGNVIDCGAVGGGNIGDDSAHESQAPFPEFLAEYHIRTFTPPGGIVLDPFIGSGTTAKMALIHRRRAIGFDLDRNQLTITGRRCACHVPINYGDENV